MYARTVRITYIAFSPSLAKYTLLRLAFSYFSFTSSTGLLKDGSSTRGGIDNPNHFRAFSIEDNKRAMNAYQMPEYLEFLEKQDHLLQSYICDLKGWQNAVRLNSTSLKQSLPEGPNTGLHYDRIFLRAGDVDFLTVWIPLGMYSVLLPAKAARVTQHNTNRGHRFLRRRHGVFRKIDGFGPQH